ncbi:MAG: hypothetical protein JXO22_13080 [Phycisphaerae bacterium]|nr:hypothetical protein [Phycisphaerae bacterium]
MISRRLLRRGSQPLVSVSRAFSALFTASDAWFDADNVTTSGGNTTAWVDRVDGSRTLAQGTGGLQAAVPAAHADFGGKNCVTFTGGQVYQSNQAAAFWNFLHASAGTAVIVLTPTVASGTQVVFETDAGGVNGISFFFAGAPAFQQVIFRGGVGGAAPINIAASVGTPSSVEQYCADASSPQRSVKRNGQAAVTAAIAGGTAGTAGQSLCLGARPAGSNALQARVRAAYFFARALSAGELGTVRAYVQADTGIAP